MAILAADVRGRYPPPRANFPVFAFLAQIVSRVVIRLRPRILDAQREGGEVMRKDLVRRFALSRDVRYVEWPFADSPCSCPTNRASELDLRLLQLLCWHSGPAQGSGNAQRSGSEVDSAHGSGLVASLEHSLCCSEHSTLASSANRPIRCMDPSRVDHGLA